jgi:hypothetical protein
MRQVGDDGDGDAFAQQAIPQRAPGALAPAPPAGMADQASRAQSKQAASRRICLAAYHCRLPVLKPGRVEGSRGSR